MRPVRGSGDIGPIMADPLVSIAAATLLSAGGWAARALTKSGALAATAIGTAILLGGGWPGAAVLGAFFILGSAIGSFTVSFIQTGVVGVGLSGFYTQFFYGLIIILSLLGHRWNQVRYR